LQISLPKEAEEALAKKAREANVAPESAALLILSEFVKLPGSHIYVGTWHRGDAGGHHGMRYVVDWPFQAGLAKIPGDQSIDLGK
jgi:hypothetical protein